MPGLAEPLVGADVIDDPYPFYARLRREAPVCPVPGTPMFLVSTWDLVVEAAARVDDFSNHFRHALHCADDGTVAVLDTGDAGPDVFAGADPPDHALHRKVFFPELMTQKMEALEGEVSALADELLDELLVTGFESPFRFHPRTARRATELGGVTIPERAMVALLWGAANRDESEFERPGEVVLDRPNARLHLGFGRGIHHCVGAPLARLEARVVLTKLLARTTKLALDPDDPPRWVDSLWIRRHEHLPVIARGA